MWRAVALFSLLPASAAAACNCATALNACRETAASGAVFIGTVESIEPQFLSQWSPEQRAGLMRLNEEYAQARQNPSVHALDRLKSEYLRLFPDLPAERKQKLQSAKTTSDLASLFYRLLDRGKYVRFEVRESFKSPEDDDEPESLEVWTPFGDCGYDFQAGETYLVYADSDEESDVLATGVCTRTRRLTDAGDDLSYLFLLKHNAERASRLEGFATTDPLFQPDFDQLRDIRSVKAPAAGVMVALESAAARRYVKTGADGKFIFDGLAAGDYTLSAFTGDYPREAQRLTAPKAMKVGDKACVSQVLVLTK